MSAVSSPASPEASPAKIDLKLDGLGVAATPFCLQLQLIFVCFRQRELEPEGGADVGFADHLNLSTVFFEDAPHD